jgi:hypothetical protein
VGANGIPPFIIEGCSPVFIPLFISYLAIL